MQNVSWRDEPHDRYMHEALRLVVDGDSGVQLYRNSGDRRSRAVGGSAADSMTTVVAVCFRIMSEDLFPRCLPRLSSVAFVALSEITCGLAASKHGFVFFFFQAEDGIRDDLVTGVQTCALPI